MPCLYPPGTASDLVCNPSRLCGREMLWQSRLIAVTRLESGARHDAQPPSKGRAVDLWHVSDGLLGGDALHIRATGRRIVWCLSLGTYTLSIVERLSHTFFDNCLLPSHHIEIHRSLINTPHNNNKPAYKHNRHNEPSPNQRRLCQEIVQRRRFSACQRAQRPYHQCATTSSRRPPAIVCANHQS